MGFHSTGKNKTLTKGITARNSQKDSGNLYKSSRMKKKKKMKLYSVVIYEQFKIRNSAYCINSKCYRRNDTYFNSLY